MIIRKKSFSEGENISYFYIIVYNIYNNYIIYRNYYIYNYKYKL